MRVTYEKVDGNGRVIETQDVLVGSLHETQLGVMALDNKDGWRVHPPAEPERFDEQSEEKPEPAKKTRSQRGE